jgi:hypothetical protein
LNLIFNLSLSEGKFGIWGHQMGSEVHQNET